MAQQMIKPFFSLIIPTLNEAKYLPDLLSDLSLQTFHNFEVIVVDGHSDDNTVKAAKKYTNSLPTLRLLNSPKRHVCAQRNLGAKNAKAETLIFMDADNRLPAYFLAGIKYRWDASSVDILTSWLKPDVPTPTNIAYAKVMNILLETQINISPIFLLEAFVVVTKSAFNHIGGFDETVNYAEGKSFIQRASKLGYKCLMVRDPIWTYSFRRVRKYGRLGMAARVALLELSDLFDLDPTHTSMKKIYPMPGGNFFEEKSRQQFISKISKRLQSGIKRKKLTDSLTTLFENL